MRTLTVHQNTLWQTKPKHYAKINAGHRVSVWLVDTFHCLVNPLLCVCLLLCCAARLSLDTMNMDSDGEREDDEEREKNQPTYSCTACPGDEIDGPRLRLPCPIARHTNMVIKLQWHIILYLLLSTNLISRPKPAAVSCSVLFNFLTLSVALSSIAPGLHWGHKSL